MVEALLQTAKGFRHPSGFKFDRLLTAHTSKNTYPKEKKRKLRNERVEYLGVKLSLQFLLSRYHRLL